MVVLVVNVTREPGVSLTGKLVSTAATVDREGREEREEREERAELEEREPVDKPEGLR